MAGLEVIVQRDLHIIELDLYTIKQGILARGAGGDLVKGIDHLDDAVEDALGYDQAQVAGRCRKGGLSERLFNAALCRASAPYKVAEALDDNAAAQHIGQTCDAFAIAVGVLEGLGEMLCYQKGKVGVVGLHGRVFITVAVDRYDAVGVLVYNGALGVHTEGSDKVAVLLGAVDYLTLIELVGQMREDGMRQLDTHADIDAVALGGNIEVAAHLFHPLAAAAAARNDALCALENLAFGGDHAIALVQLLDRVGRGVEEELDLIPQMLIEVFQHDIVDVGAQMPYRGIQQVEAVLQAELFDVGVGGGIELGALAAVLKVDLIDIVHQLQSLGLADIFIESSAKLIRDVILTVGKCACAAEAVHNRAGLAADARLDLFAVDGAFSFIERVAGLEDSHPELRLKLYKLIGREDAAGACTDYQYVIFHIGYLLFIFLPFQIISLSYKSCQYGIYEPG